VTSLRVFAIGGLMSYRALFYWLTPWVYVPSLLVAPIFQILLFVYIGRNAGLESDEFYVIGNALQYAAIPCVFAMGFAISGERYQQTLGPILVSPAPRLPLFLGRAVPVMLNGALGLRVREVAVLANIIFGLLLIFTGANVPVDELPGWMQAISELAPLTHGIEAARLLADGASLGSVDHLIFQEIVVGIGYGLVGYGLLRFFEWQGRVRATLETA
jgi:ABC-2 type transport system permease protein